MSLKKIILGICVLLMSCNESGKEPDNDIYSEEKLVNNIIDTYALPQLQSFAKDAEDIKKDSEEFLINSTEANLLVLKNKWRILAKSWGRSFTFNIGDIRRNKYYLQKLAFFPVNEQGLRELINKTPEITLVDLNERASTSTGIMSLGYLLHSDASVANNLEASKIVLEFKNSENRKKILRFIVDKIIKDAKDFNNDWIVYAKELKNNEAKQGTIESSFSLLFNGLNNVINYSWETKIASPAGFGNSGFNPTKVEAPYSRNSLELIKENIRYTKEIFFSTKGESIANAVKFVTKNSVLTNKVKSQYEAIESAIDAFDHSLYDSLTDDFEKVKKLEQELKKLQVLFKVDITSTLSLVNTNTDGDGD